MRAATAISVAFIGVVALLEKGQDALPRPNPDEHWRDELDGEAWIIESTQKALQDDRRKLEKLRDEPVGYERDGSCRFEQTSLEWEVQRLRSKVNTNEDLIRRSCSDYREYAQKLADEEPGLPRTAPAACDSF